MDIALPTCWELFTYLYLRAKNYSDENENYCLKIVQNKIPLICKQWLSGLGAGFSI